MRVLTGSLPTPLALLPAPPEILGALEGPEEVERRDETGEKRDEEATGDQGVHRATEDVDQEHRQHHQRYRSKQQREHPHGSSIAVSYQRSARHPTGGFQHVALRATCQPVSYVERFVVPQRSPTFLPE